MIRSQTVIIRFAHLNFQEHLFKHFKNLSLHFFRYCFLFFSANIPKFHHLFLGLISIVESLFFYDLINFSFLFLIH
jgi:hypothetical protein